MSKGQATDAGGSRHTNQNNSVNPSTVGTQASDESGVPTVEDRIAEFYDKYPERASLPLTSQHGHSIREEYTYERREEWSSESLTEMDDHVKGSTVVERGSVTWSEAVATTLESHEDTRKTTINLEHGRPSDPEYATFSIDAETRWFASYQRRYYAQMKAWLRELCGGERPSGGETTAFYDDPHIALITLSATSIPGGERVGPVEHASARRESWGDVYDTLRNTMRAHGFDTVDGWQYDRRAEPHTGERGGGANHCYGHDHIVLVVDGSVAAADLRPIVEKHVESCDWAGASAHDLDIADWNQNEEEVETVEVKPANEVDDLANYVASYCGIEPVDLLERSTEYIAWASAVTAANLKTVSRSDAANHASTADSCKQRAESSKADQDADHGENIVRSTRRGYEFECAECGSPHGIDQSHDTLTAARTSDQIAADGGLDQEDDLREQWPSARSAGGVGESPRRARWREQIRDYLELHPDASPAQIMGELQLPPEAKEVLREIDSDFDPDNPEGFDGPPEWRVRSVTVGDEEYPASAGNGVNMVETKHPVEHLLDETKLGAPDAERVRWRCKRTNVAVKGGRSMAGYLVKHGIEHPEVVDEVVKAVRVPDPNGLGTVAASNAPDDLIPDSVS